MNNLVVVESPAKSVTIGRYLNDSTNSKNFKILATGGHIYESNKVDVEEGFRLNYDLIPSKRKSIDMIEKAMRTADCLYLATDPDREGEAISAHVYDFLERRGVLKDKKVHRIVFYEVTQQAVLDSIAKPGEVSESLVQAQQSRDALDWLVGYNLSPLLIRKLRTQHLSAGRVQSPALRLVVERQREIERFNPVEYWTIGAELSKLDGAGNPAVIEPIKSQLSHLSGNKLKKHDIGNAEAANAAIEAIESALQQTNQELTVSAVNKKQRKRKPPPPFKTSTLVQAASQRLKRSAADVARIAQKLYEGLEIDGSLTGLITYTRTDSLTLSTVATGQIREFITGKYGQRSVPTSPRTYRTKSKTAQEAHEAIRPTNIFLTPDKVRSSLSPEQFAIYDLIWRRTVASQMNDAVFDEVSVEFEVDSHRFRTSGSTLVSPGWLAVLKTESAKERDSDNNQSLPSFVEGERVPVLALSKEQHFTQPPPRYNTGSLVKQLEEYGIGRPSTWPTIINKLIDRNYITVQNQSFYAQSLGCIVADYLNQHFELYVDYDFTGKVEDKLDDIAQGELQRLSVLNEFWAEFSSHLQSKLEAPGFEVVLGQDPKTGRDLLVRVRNGGLFLQLGRRTDPEKPQFRPLPSDIDPAAVSLEEAIKSFAKPSLPKTLEQKTKDGHTVEIKSGRYGPYFSCTDDDGTVTNFNLGDGIDPHSVTIEQIEEILALPKLPRSLGKSDDYDEIVAKSGRFGPYLAIVDSNGLKFNVNIGKADNPATITLERAIEIIKTSNRKPGSKGRSRTVIKDFQQEGIQVLDGRYGPYVTDGKINANVPNSLVAAQLDLDTCQELIEKKRQQGSKPKNRSPARRRKRSN